MCLMILYQIHTHLSILLSCSPLLSWKGEGEQATGLDKATGTVRVKVDPKYYRPTEVVSLLPTMIEVLL